LIIGWLNRLGWPLEAIDQADASSLVLARRPLAGLWRARQRCQDPQIRDRPLRSA
jgi:hypothetical protein